MKDQDKTEPLSGVKYKRTTEVTQFGIFGTVLFIAYQALGLMGKLDDRFVTKEIYKMGTGEVVRAVERLEATMQESIRDDGRRLSAAEAAITSLQVSESYRRAREED